MDITFERVPDEDAEPAWEVLVDGAVVGRLEHRRLLGRGYSKSFMGTRHVNVWTGTVAHVDLDDDDRRSVQRELRRDKTTRRTGALHIIDAYKKAGVPLPELPADRRAA